MSHFIELISATPAAAELQCQQFTENYTENDENAVAVAFNATLDII